MAALRRKPLPRYLPANAPIDEAARTGQPNRHQAELQKTNRPGMWAFPRMGYEVMWVYHDPSSGKQYVESLGQYSHVGPAASATVRAMGDRPHLRTIALEWRLSPMIVQRRICPPVLPRKMRDS